ncbi:hypothetical protein D3C71_1449650 [compost metagenome]
MHTLDPVAVRIQAAIALALHLGDLSVAQTHIQPARRLGQGLVGNAYMRGIPRLRQRHLQRVRGLAKRDHRFVAVRPQQHKAMQAVHALQPRQDRGKRQYCNNGNTEAVQHQCLRCR